MSAVVVIPAWHRPEMLAICLKKIMAADGWEKNRYHLSFDGGMDEQNWHVFGDWEFGGALCPGFASSAWVEMGRRGNGNSGNILRGLETGLKLAEELGAEQVHLLEEDVWIGRDYFRTHELLQRQYQPWAVSLCKNQHLRIDRKQDPSLCYKSRDYQSLGVSFPLDSVREILLHNTDEYFRDMPGYIRAMFPNSKYGGLFTEQDGLIARIIEKNNYDMVYSNLPRAFHAGFYSYHRSGIEPEGTLEEKIACLENMPEEEMNRRSNYKDIRFADLNGFNVNEFILDETANSGYNS
jgi:hypothetical protein